MAEGPFGVYIHVPFCVRRCAYCDFNTYAGLEHLLPRTLEAIEREIESCPHDHPQAGSVFVGGGTPTVAPPDRLRRLLRAVENRFGTTTDCEVTVEANPNTTDTAVLGTLREAGFNRLSLGVQSFDDALLRRLGRSHSAREAEMALRQARDAGFDNVSIDLMFGLPGQSARAWQQTLERAVELGPDHVSAYGLTIEPDTPFHARWQQGKLRLPGERAQTTMLAAAMEYLPRHGYERYEVSNYARPGRRCRHNLLYWRNEAYAGFGPGAASYVGGRRWTTVARPEAYIAAVEAGADTCAQSETLSPDVAAAETLILALRLTEGCDLRWFRSRHAESAERALQRARPLVEAGLLEEVEGQLRATHRGMLTLTDVSAALLP